MSTLLVVPYFVVLGVLCLYGLHRFRLVLYCWLHRDRIRAATLLPAATDDQALPVVTIQLPLYNEATVVDRLLAAVGQMDYPRHLLEVQVLDDSTDETQQLAQAKVAELRTQGLDIQYVRRPNREGYKAGALDYGLARARGELIAIFDADFVPQPSFLRAIVGTFADARVGLVQTRWAHLNRDANLLTSVQALMLDGHHLVENRARFGAGLMWNFSGTGGIWRRTAIVDAGGWQHDTLTEDLDLSYRAQLRGWRFVYRPDVLTPAELPEDLSAFRAQQFRWAKGTAQTAVKLMADVWRSPLSLNHKIEAFFHLTPHFAYPLIVALTILLLPALLLLPVNHDLVTLILVDMPLFGGSTGSLALFYVLANRAQGRSALSALLRLPLVIAIGAGLAPHQARAVFAGVRSKAGEFVRTPKRGTNQGRYRQATELPWHEFGLGALSLVNLYVAGVTGHWLAAPFAALFAAGYLSVAVIVLSEQRARERLEAGDSAPSSVRRLLRGLGIARA